MDQSCHSVPTWQYGFECLVRSKSRPRRVEQVGPAQSIDTGEANLDVGVGPVRARLVWGGGAGEGQGVSPLDQAATTAMCELALRHSSPHGAVPVPRKTQEDPGLPSGRGSALPALDASTRRAGLPKLPNLLSGGD